jgi:hypothetical protein
MPVRSLIARSVRYGLLPAVAVALVLAVAPAASAASGDLIWNLTVDSPPHWDESGLSLAPGPDGTVYAAGNWADDSLLWQTADVTLLRLRPSANPAGTVVWQRMWDGPSHLADYPAALTRDSAGNAVSAGLSYVSEADTDLFVIKWKPNGKRAWVARYASAYGMADWPVDVACDHAGNVYVAGSRKLLGNEDGDWLTIKFRGSDGKRLWARPWSGTETAASDDGPAAIAVDAAGSSYSVGYSDDAHGVQDAIIMKRTPAGKLAWLRRVDGSLHLADTASRVVLAGGQVYVAGLTGGLGGSRLLALKYATSGKLLWGRTQALSEPAVSVRDFVVDRAGNAVAVGYANDGDRNLAMVASWTAAGKARWSDVYSPLSGTDAIAYSVVVNRSGTVWVAGTMNPPSKGMVLKYSAAGTRVWARFLSLDGSTRNGFYALCLWGSGSLAVAGASTNNATGTDFLVARYVR